MSRRSIVSRCHPHHCCHQVCLTCHLTQHSAFYSAYTVCVDTTYRRLPIVFSPPIKTPLFASTTTMAELARSSAPDPQIRGPFLEPDFEKGSPQPDPSSLKCKAQDDARGSHKRPRHASSPTASSGLASFTPRSPCPSTAFSASTAEIVSL